MECTKSRRSGLNELDSLYEAHPDRWMRAPKPAPGTVFFKHTK
jgi:hypothetical protein